jgi:hypothetical protein
MTYKNAVRIIFEEIYISGYISEILVIRGKYKILFDHPRESVTSFVESEIKDIKILDIPSSDMLNSIVYSWTAPTIWEAVEELPLEDPSLETNDEIHQLSYDLTGFLLLSQAKRVATYLINSRLSDLIVQFWTYNSKGLQPLDRFSLTHSIGLTEKSLYATSVEPQGDGSYIITGREYDPAFFSDVIVDEPTYPDTDLPDPSSIPTDATDLILTEELQQLRDSTWISNIKMSWTASTWPFVKHYEISASLDGGITYTKLGITTATNYELRAVLELTNYYIKVVTVSTWNKVSSGLINNFTPQGKFLKPTWKDGAALSATEAGDVVILKWHMPDNSAPAIDIDIIGYEVRRGFTTDIWATASFITFVDALVYLDKNCPSGIWRYFLKAKDSVGGYTDTAKYADVTVTLNPYMGFQQDWDFDLDGASVENAKVARVALDTDWGFPSYDYLWTQRFNVTKVWNDATQPYPLSTYLQWGVPVPAPGGVYYGFITLVTNEIDLSQVISGRFTLYKTITKIGDASASVTPYLYTKQTIGESYVKRDASSTIDGISARYLMADFEFENSDDKSYYIVKERVYVNIQANPKQDYGIVAVPVEGVKSIIFATTFLAITKPPTLTPLGAIPRTALPDNLTLVGMDICLFDAAGNPVSGDVMWQVDGC